MKVEIYSLFLLNFEDDSIVFSEEQLAAFNRAIGDRLERPSTPGEGGWRTYDLKGLAGFFDHPPERVTIDSITLGYYHHRIIVRMDVQVDPRAIRTARDYLHRAAVAVVSDLIQPAMNAVVFEQGGTIEGMTSYPLVIAHGAPRPARRQDSFPFTMETSSLTFEVAEPFLLWNRVHLMRISIGSSILYVDQDSWFMHRQLSFDVAYGLKRDLINGIYQYCLYPSKLEEDGRIEERLLVRLWEHIVDTTGGSLVQVNGVRMGQKNLFFAVLAVITGLLALDFWR